MLSSSEAARLCLSFCLGCILTYTITPSPGLAVKSSNATDTLKVTKWKQVSETPRDGREQHVVNSSQYVELKNDCSIQGYDESLSTVPLFSHLNDMFKNAKLLPYVENDLLEILANNSLMSHSELSRFNNPASFAYRYFEATNTNFYDSAERKNEIDYLESWFSSSHESPEVESSFSKDVTTIYLHLNVEGVLAKDVIVKWYKADTGERVLLRRFTVNSQREKDFFWVKRKQWDEGVYNVEIFSADEELNLLAANQFVVY